MDATEQIKNLTLAGSRTQVPGFSSADAVTAMPRVPVAGPEFFILISFQILNSQRCLPFMWTFIHDMLLIVFLFFLHNCPLLIPLHNTAVLNKIYIYILPRWCTDGKYEYIKNIYKKRHFFRIFYIRIYRQCTTEEGHRSVRKLWSFNYSFVGLKYHDYALYLCFVHK